MTFEVRTTPDAEEDAAAILNWLMTEHAGEAGLRWFLKLDEAISSLGELPKRCKLAPENASFPFEVRELLYGQKPHVYRILFTIEGNVVYVLHLRHGRRATLSAS
jgi:plasmid stabilization system protein ParE